MTEDIEVLRVQNWVRRKKYYIEKESDEINQKDMSDEKYSDEIDHVIKDDEEKVSDYIEVLKLGKLSLQKIIDNVEKKSDKREWMDIINDGESGERDQIG